MRMDIYHHIVLDSEVKSSLDGVHRKLDLIISKENQIMSAMTDALDQAEAAAKANSDADDAAEKLLVALSAQIAALAAAGTDPATLTRITALADALKARAAQLGTAVAANTPAAP